MTLRRLFFILSIVVTGSLGFAAAATAAGSPGGGKGGPLGPGDYAFTDTFASATFGAPPAKGGLPQFFIKVDRNTSSFKPEEGQDSSTKDTTVSLQVATTAINGFGCFTINPSDFTVSKDLQRAALHTTLSTPCAAKGGTGGGLPDSIRLDITWAGNGVVATTRDKNSFTCAGYALDRNAVDTNAAITAAGAVSLKSVSLWPQSAADSATLSSSDIRMHINGVEKDACLALQGSGA